MSERREFLRTEWHPTLNNGLTIDDVTDSSAKKIWWICSVNPEHIWDARFFSRNKDNRKCPYCAGHKIMPKDSLGYNFPKLLAEWDFEKNKNIDPFKIRSTDKKVWWICSEKKHNFQAYVHHRIAGGRNKQGTNCPYCDNQKPCADNDLFNYPELAKEFHPTLNGNKTPKDIISGSHEKIWWQCPIGIDHIYDMKVYERTRLGLGCVFCSGHRICTSTCLATTHPTLIDDWHSSNILTPYQVTYASNKRILWKCIKCNYEWKVAISTRTRRKLLSDISLCPVCNASKGAKFIFDYLVGNKIFYRTEFKINECRSIRPLPFDFAVFNSSGSLYGLIEYQGRHHYMVLDKFGGEKVFKEVQIRDKIKSDYCIANNIRFLAIPYTEKNLTELLDNFFKDLEK